MEPKSMPHFVTPLRRRIWRFPMNEPCELHSLDTTFTPTASEIATVTAIANEEQVSRWLFHRLLQGHPSLPEQAHTFFHWAREGWQKHSWFVFVVRDSQQQIVAAIDIKSNALTGAEIGYWATAKRPAVMTNTVLQLAQIAREAGYGQFYALVSPQNSRSAAVLLRAGFVNEGEILRENIWKICERSPGRRVMVASEGGKRDLSLFAISIVSLNGNCRSKRKGATREYPTPCAHCSLCGSNNEEGG